MTDLIVIAILAVVLGSAIRYMVKAKKSGACIGCPAQNCPSCCHGFEGREKASPCDE